MSESKQLVQLIDLFNGYRLVANIGLPAFRFSFPIRSFLELNAHWQQ